MVFSDSIKGTFLWILGYLYRKQDIKIVYEEFI